MADPKPNEVLLAYARGVEDFRLLTAAQNRLDRMPKGRKTTSHREIESRFKELRGSFAWENLPPKEFAAARAEGKPWQATIPELDVDELVRMAKQALVP